MGLYYKKLFISERYIEREDHKFRWLTVVAVAVFSFSGVLIWLGTLTRSSVIQLMMAIAALLLFFALIYGILASVGVTNVVFIDSSGIRFGEPDDDSGYSHIPWVAVTKFTVELSYRSQGTRHSEPHILLQIDVDRVSENKRKGVMEGQISEGEVRLYISSLMCDTEEAFKQMLRMKSSSEIVEDKVV